MAKSWMCQRCADADSLGSKRKCAFTSSGRFRRINWSCETMMALRGAASFRQRDDLSAGSIAVVRLPDALDVQGWLVLSYYKDHGATPGAVIVDDEGERIDLTLHRAEKALEVFGV